MSFRYEVRNLPCILCIETGTDTCSVGLARDSELIALRESHGERDHARRVATYTEDILIEAGLRAGDLSAVAVGKGPGSYTGLRIGVSFAKGLCYGLGIPLIGIGSLDSLCALAVTNYELRIRNMAVNSLPSVFPSCGWVARSAGVVITGGQPDAPHNPEFRDDSTDVIPTEPERRRGTDDAERGQSSLLGLSSREEEDRRSICLVPMIDARRMEVYGQVFDAQGNPGTEPEAWVIDENSLARLRDKDVFIFGSGAEKCRETLPWAHFIDVQPSARGMVKLAAEAFDAGQFENTAYFEPFYLKDFVITTTGKKLF